MKGNMNMNKKSFYVFIFKSILYLCILAPFFRVDSISYLFPQFLNIFKYGRIISFLIIVIMFVIDKKISKIIIFILLYLLGLLTSSILNPSLSLFESLIFISNIITLCMICDYGIRHDLKILLNSLIVILLTLSLVNLYSLFRYPYGMYVNAEGYVKNWVLGYKNSLILYLLPLITFTSLKSLIFKNKVDLLAIISFGVSLLSILIVNSSTGIIGLGIITLYFIFRKFIANYSDIFNSNNYAIAYLVAFFSIIVLRIQKFFSFLIVDLLHKDLTFTGRVYIWDSVFEYIKQRPLLGYGNLVFQYSSNIISTHNAILDVLYRSGFVGLGFYMLIVFSTLYKLYQNRKNHIALFLAIILFAYFIMMFTEAFNISYYFYILVFCYNIKYLIDENNLHIRKDVK